MPVAGRRICPLFLFQPDQRLTPLPLHSLHLQLGVQLDRVKQHHRCPQHRAQERRVYLRARREAAQRSKVAGTITVILDDQQNIDAEAYGGAEMDNPQRIHFQTSELADINDGETLTLAEPKPGQPGQTVQTKKIVTGSVTSADGAELIVTVRGA